jgi:acetyl esterase/lipase
MQLLSTMWARWRAIPRPTRRALWAVAGVANGRAPRRFSRVFQVPSFFWAWITTEAAFPLLLLHLWRAWRGRRSIGSPVLRELTSGVDLATAVGLGAFIAEGAQADDQFTAALAPYLGDDVLAARPSSVRAGAWLPLLYGGRKRRLRTRNVVFSPEGEKVRLKLDVYQPVEPWDPEGARRPALVQIHGGAWLIGDKREQGIPLLNHMAANGWVGFNVNYRLSPRAKAPDHLVDCKRAIAWIREHADEYGIDPDFICVTGGSAGGHLAAMVALTGADHSFQPGFEDADCTVQGAIPFYGVYDLVDDEGLMIPGFREMLIEPIVFGAKFAADGAPFQAYSPIARVGPDAPPMMIVHGSRDALVPVETARRFARRMTDVSEHAVVYVELYGAQHAFDIFPSPRTVRTIEYCQQFLDAVHKGVIK